MVKLYTIVKDECDIVRDWINYHGSMFGWHNIYIIDNYSTDGTYEIIQEFKDLINIYREPDYSKKGEYMTKLIKMHSVGDDKIAFPIDIDEFIVYLEPGTKMVDINKNSINYYLNNLPARNVYKANYLYPIPTQKEGYIRATAETDYSSHCDLGHAAKSFINTQYFNGSIDHGNHIYCTDYLLTNILLVHYHFRNVEQMRKKSANNVIGLGYNLSLEELRKLPGNVAGRQHVDTQIAFQENRYELPTCCFDANNSIIITPLKNRIIGGCY